MRSNQVLLIRGEYYEIVNGNISSWHSKKFESFNLTATWEKLSKDTQVKKHKLGDKKYRMFIYL